jgi:hypothetical protein
MSKDLKGQVRASRFGTLLWVEDLEVLGFEWYL